MKKLSGFDIGLIIVFVVITLLGGAAVYYCSSKLSDAQDRVRNASDEYDKYSTKQVYLPVKANQTALQANIDLIQNQIDPLVQAKLQPANNKLQTEKEDPVTWKRELDDEVTRLNASAKTHGVTVPPNFYYGFSRYLNPTPGEDQTVVLSKQLRAIEEIANILIGAPVKSIASIRRTYEEDGLGSAGAAPSHTDSDFLDGHAVQAPGNIYTAYPFDLDFTCTTVAFRKVINDLNASPYVFVIRLLAVENSKLDSPQIADLDKLAGPESKPVSVTESSPGEVAASHPVKGPQFIFGNEVLQVHLHLDLIEWHGPSATPDDATKNHHGSNGSKGGHP